DASTETQDHASTHTNQSPPPDGPAKRSDLLGGLHGQLRQRSKRPYRPLTDIACRTRRTKIGQHVRTTPRERLHMINVHPFGQVTPADPAPGEHGQSSGEVVGGEVGRG